MPVEITVPGRSRRDWNRPGIDAGVVIGRLARIRASIKTTIEQNLPAGGKRREHRQDR